MVYRSMRVCMFLILVMTVAYINYNEEYFTRLQQNGDKFPKPYPTNCPNNLLTCQNLGRLGNVMGEYATLWGLARNLKRSAVISQGMKKELLQHFRHISLHVLEDIPKSSNCSFNWSGVRIAPPFDREQWLKNDLLISNLQSKRGNINIRQSPITISLFHPYAVEIRKEFQFKEKILGQVQIILRNIEYCHTRNCVFIGVHARRTDYGAWMKLRHNSHIATQIYFLKAMKVMISNYPEAVFVVVSDDIDWCKQQLNFTSFHVEFVHESPIVDMALLASCNHSIISHGTYGFWGAYLSGGNVVMPSNFSSILPDPQAEVLKSRIKGWKLVPASRR